MGNCEIPSNSINVMYRGLVRLLILYGIINIKTDVFYISFQTHIIA